MPENFVKREGLKFPCKVSLTLAEGRASIQKKFTKLPFGDGEQKGKLWQAQFFFHYEFFSIHGLEYFSLFFLFHTYPYSTVNLYHPPP